MLIGNLPDGRQAKPAPYRYWYRARIVRRLTVTSKYERTHKKYMVNCNIIELVDIYDKAGRQLYNLSKAWSKFKRQIT